MEIVIESLGNEIISDYCFKGYIGAINAGYNVSKLSLSSASLSQTKLKNEKPMPIGSVGYMEYFFDLYGIKKPLPLQATSNLTKASFIKQWVVPFRSELKYPVFVKPYLDIKKFTGFVAKSENDFELYPELKGWDGPYLCAKPFDSNIQAEWRCFVHNGKVVNMSYYNGINPRITPDYWTLGFLIEQYLNPPVAYSLDVAILTNGDTKYIELNDMWAIGPYGLNEDLYFEMLKDRWNEIIKNYDAIN